MTSNTTSTVSDNAIFPLLLPQSILECQFSSWYPKFANVSIRSTVITPLEDGFEEYLHADGVFVPKGSEDDDAISEDESMDGACDTAEDPKSYSFPELDIKIREAILEYGAVFPKLNWSSPKDAQWILSTSEFMRCSSPADVYLLLKASDFITHDLDPARVFDGIGGEPSSYKLELVLRKWYPIHRSREFRCFVRDGRLIGISQRDLVYYDHLNVDETRASIQATIKSFWEQKVKPRWEGTSSYVFDVLLTKDLGKAHIIDINPFSAKTDPLLFTYEDLFQLYLASSNSSPMLRIIDSPSHPLANGNNPLNQHNMVPVEALTLSHGETVEDFASKMAEAIRKANNDTLD